MLKQLRDSNVVPTLVDGTGLPILVRQTIHDAIVELQHRTVNQRKNRVRGDRFGNARQSKPGAGRHRHVRGARGPTESSRVQKLSVATDGERPARHAMVAQKRLHQPVKSRQFGDGLAACRNLRSGFFRARRHAGSSVSKWQFPPQSRTTSQFQCLRGQGDILHGQTDRFETA